jgi:tetratricopeptide (TPR) repeat protein
MSLKNFFGPLSLTALLLCGAIAVAQDKEKEQEANIVAVAEGACECCYKISVDLNKDKIVEEINSCITQSSVLLQMKQSLMGTKEEETIVVDNDTISSRNVIVADKNFDAIQAYMLQNCGAVKQLMASDNEELKHSMSKNKKALAFYEEGTGYFQKEQYDLALLCFNKAVKADPKFAFAWDNLGICHRHQGNYKEAIKCYEKSLALDPMGRVPLMSMAVAYALLEDYKSSAETYTKYIKLHPNDPEGYYGAGRSYYFNDEYAAGVDYMFKAYLMYTEAKSPYVTDAQNMLSVFYNELKDKNKLDIFIQAAKNNNIEITD